MMAVARWRGGGHHLVQDAVGPHADLEIVFKGLEVQVAGVVLDGHKQDHVQQLADRGAFRQSLGTGQVDGPFALQGLGLSHKLFVGLDVGDDRLHAFAHRRVIALQRPLDIALCGHHAPHLIAQKAPQLVDDRQALGVGHGDGQRVIAEADGDDLVQLRHGLRHVGKHLRRDGHLVEVDNRQAHLLGQGVGQLLFGDHPHIQGDLP